MQRFVFLLLAASVALLGIIVPVEATFLPKSETNGQRFARGLPPLPPVERSPTDTAMRRRASQKPTTYPTGRLEVRKTSGEKLGYVYNSVVGPSGLNLISDNDPDAKDLVVEFQGHSLVALHHEFPSPNCVGATGYIRAKSTNSIPITNVANRDNGGADAQIWDLGENNQLTPTWFDGSREQNQYYTISLMYNSALNKLYFVAAPKSVISSEFYEVNMFLVV